MVYNSFRSFCMKIKFVCPFVSHSNPCVHAIDMNIFHNVHNEFALVMVLYGQINKMVKLHKCFQISSHYGPLCIVINLHKTAPLNNFLTFSIYGTRNMHNRDTAYIWPCKKVMVFS